MNIQLPADELRIDDAVGGHPAALRATPSGRWLARVRHGRVRRIWAPRHREAGRPAAADPGEVDYLVDPAIAPPPAIGTAVDPEALGWVEAERP